MAGSVAGPLADALSHPILLSDQADELEAGIEAVARCSQDANAVLDRLTKHLGTLCKLSQPIYDQAVRLTKAEQNMAAAKVATEKLLTHLKAPQQLEPSLRQGLGRDLDAYMAQLAQLQEAMTHLEDMHDLGIARNAYLHASQVQHTAVQDCEADFASVLSQQTAASMPSATTLLQQIEEGNLKAAIARPSLPEFTPQALSRLKYLAGLLQQYSKTCLASHAQIRRKALQGLLQSLAPGNVTLTSIQLQTAEQAEKAAASWSRQLQLLTLSCATELALAQALWGNTLAWQVVGEVVAQPVQNLASQCKSMCKAKLQQPQRVFAFLDMLQGMEEVMPLLDKLLRPSSGCESALDSLEEAQDELGRAARDLFQSYEASITRDTSKVQLLDGSVHPLIASSLSYLRKLFAYPNVEQVLFLDGGRGGGGLAELSEQVAKKRMKESVERCMEGLMQSLDAKAKAYKSRALAEVFLLNNVHYMVSTVNQSEALSVIGQDWLERHKEITKQHCEAYEELVWTPVIKTLKAIQSGNDAAPSDTSKLKEWIKKHFKAVNALMERASTEQTAWVVPDMKLRSAVCRVILQDLLPAYQHFWDTFSREEFTSKKTKYLRFSPEDVKRLLEKDVLSGKQPWSAAAQPAQKQHDKPPTGIKVIASEPSITQSMPGPSRLSNPSQLGPRSAK